MRSPCFAGAGSRGPLPRTEQPALVLHKRSAAGLAWVGMDADRIELGNGLLRQIQPGCGEIFPQMGD